MNEDCCPNGCTENGEPVELIREYGLIVCPDCEFYAVESVRSVAPTC